jgi:hypothetical protein
MRRIISVGADGAQGKDTEISSSEEDVWRDRSDFCSQVKRDTEIDLVD